MGSFAGIAVVGLIADYAFDPATFPTFFAAEGAAATLIFALPLQPASTCHLSTWMVMVMSGRE
jgi:CBS-domain-containing membrane protein